MNVRLCAEYRLRVAWGCLLNNAVSTCLSSLDLKRKGIGNVCRVQTVQLGCDSRNYAGNKSVVIITGVFTGDVHERRALLETYRIYINPSYRQ